MLTDLAVVILGLLQVKDSATTGALFKDFDQFRIKINHADPCSIPLDVAIEN